MIEVGNFVGMPKMLQSFGILDIMPAKSKQIGSNFWDTVLEFL
jgi:hypothetical protein